MNGIIKKTDLQLTINEGLAVGGYLYDRDSIYRIKAVNDDGSIIVDTVNPETLEVIDNTFKKDFRIGKGDLHYYNVLGVDVEKIKQMAERLLNGEAFEEFTESSDTALMSLGSKETLMILRDNINRAAIVAEKTRKYADILIQQKTRELEARLRPMREMIEKMGREVKRLDYVIQTIETYAGIKENVEQLHAGEPAPETTPIVFRQAVIFMDEELALIDDDFDWQKVDKFDEWLLQNDRYKEFMPDEKSMVAIKPRRTDKKYAEDGSIGGAITNRLMNIPNHHTVFLIRNGENLYKIDSEHIYLFDRMYPNKEEYLKILEKEQQYTHVSGTLESENFRKQYTQVAFLMQGLVERSDVFSPHTVTGSLIKMEGFTDEQIQLRYELDTSRALGDGRPSVGEWMKSMNSQLCEGKRVLLIVGKYSTEYGYHFNDEHDFVKYYTNKWSSPELPTSGIYTLEKQDEGLRKGYWDSYDFLIKYMPASDVRGYWEDSKRKNRVSIRIALDNDGILNYDDMKIEDVEYYLNSRLHRSQYFRFVRLLKEFKNVYLKELEAENEYIKMFVGQIMAKGLQPKDGITAESVVRVAIDTIKNRLKWKRPITAKEKETYTLVERTLFSQAFRNKYFK
jgi:hypothetical protein